MDESSATITMPEAEIAGHSTTEAAVEMEITSRRGRNAKIRALRVGRRAPSTANSVTFTTRGDAPPANAAIRARSVGFHAYIVN